MEKGLPKTPPWVAFWVVLCALLNCAGWILSALHALNAAGYAVAGTLLAAGFFLWARNRWRNKQPLTPAHSPLVPRGAREKTARQNGSWKALKKQCRRFKRLFPLAFLTLALMAFVSGIIYAPNNYDALAYRLPRALHWLAEGRWHWIHTQFHRLNTRACGYEWVAAPLMALTKTDRLLFLINLTSFLLLPGLIFSAATRLGVRRRAAWHWMWLLPSGYCYVLQAGGVANDMFSAVFALASLDFALRARVSRSLGNLWLSMLAAGLLTAGKTSNIPLLLPWMIAIFPVLPCLLNRIVVTAAVGVVAALASFLPMAALNYRHCGDWTGVAAERPLTGKGEVLLHIEHNSMLMLIQNLAPPIFPWSASWNKAVVKLIPPERMKRLAQNFEPNEGEIRLPEMQMEEGAGLGFGVTAMLLAGFFLGLKRAKASSPRQAEKSGGFRSPVIYLSPYISMLVFMTKMGYGTISRLITPYYGLLVPALLMGAAQERLVRRTLWQRAGLAVFALAGIMLVVAPTRPLWPARTVLGKLDGNSPVVKRALAVYSVFGERANGFAPALKQLPPGIEVLGVVTFDDPETSLWKPFGGRRIEHVIAADTPEYLRTRGIEYVLVSSGKFGLVFAETFEDWLARMDAEVAETIPLALRAGVGPVDWYLVKLRHPQTNAGATPREKSF